MSEPCVVDNMILAMFVDADRSDLLHALAGGSIYVTPTIVDPLELPPFANPPLSEFARGLAQAEQNLDEPLSARRLRLRTQFYAAQANGLWTPIELSEDELRFAHTLTSTSVRAQVGQKDPTFKSRRVDPGEAECAAVAITRGWTLWSDDQAIVSLVRALHPLCNVERLCGLLVRAVAEGLIDCPNAAHLYNQVFKGELSLWSKLSLHCDRGVATCREP